MTMRRMLITGTAITMMGAAPALAAEYAGEAKDAKPAAEMQKADMQKAEKMRAEDATVMTVLVADVDPAVLALPYRDVDGMDVHSVSGEEIGELEGLYRGTDGRIYARMNIGGDWFDIVKEEVAVPLTAFRMEGDELRLPITEAEAEALEEWADGDYEDAIEEVQ